MIIDFRYQVVQGDCACIFCSPMYKQTVVIVLCCKLSHPTIQQSSPVTGSQQRGAAPIVKKFWDLFFCSNGLLKVCVYQFKYSKSTSKQLLDLILPDTQLLYTYWYIYLSNTIQMNDSCRCLILLGLKQFTLNTLYRGSIGPL